MPLKSNKDGTYTVNWIPSVAGTYVIQIYIDSTNTGLSASYISIVIVGLTLGCGLMQVKSTLWK